MAEKTPERSNSDQAIPKDEDATADVLLERLKAWKHAVSYLEDYIGATETMYKHRSKEYEKILKTISDPLREGHHFDQAIGGVAGLLENMRTNTSTIANSNTEVAKALKGSVLPTLERLHHEIKNKEKELTSGAKKGSKAVAQARERTQRHIELLGQHSANYDSAGSKIDPNNDPYLLQRGINHRLNKQIIEENNHRQDLLGVQNNFKAFEGHVVGTVQNAMGLFYQHVGQQSKIVGDMYSDITATAQKMPLDFEWNGFVKRNPDVLIDPQAPKRDLKSTTFPNQGHISTKPLIEGVLQRKGKIMRSYNSGHYVVTPSGYLMEFKDNNDDYAKDPESELSLYLPESTLGAYAGGKFNISGKDANKNKSLAMKHEFAFKASTDAEGQKWYDIVKARIGTKSDEAPATPISPTDSRKNTMPPDYEANHGEEGKQVAPINTKSEYADQQVASPQSAHPAAEGAGSSAASPLAIKPPSPPANTPAAPAQIEGAPAADKQKEIAAV